jgi:hypothetical protein
VCNIKQYAGLWPADLPKYTQFSFFVEIKKNYTKHVSVISQKEKKYFHLAPT